MLQLVMWVTPAGTMDEGGIQQPAYLNFDIALLGPPAGNRMEVSHPCSPSPWRKNSLTSVFLSGS